MTAVEILPRLWIGNQAIAQDIDFFKINNIRYVVNLTYNIDNFFNNITYLNIPLSQDIMPDDQSNMALSIDKLFNIVNQFITYGYYYNIGILIHDNTGKLSLMFACAFFIQKLKMPYYETLKYLFYHTNFNIGYIINNPFLLKFNSIFFITPLISQTIVPLITYI